MFTDPTITEKIEYARKKDFQVLMLTDTSLLTVEKFKEFDDLGITSIRISFYGNSPVIYNTIHNIQQKNLFDKIKKVNGNKPNTI